MSSCTALGIAAVGFLAYLLLQFLTDANPWLLYGVFACGLTAQFGWDKFWGEK